MFCDLAEQGGYLKGCKRTNKWQQKKCKPGKQFENNLERANEAKVKY